MVKSVSYTHLAGNVGKRETPGYASGGTDSNSELGEQGWLSVAHQTIMMHPYLPETYDGLYTATTQNNTSLPNSPLAAIYESGYKHTNSCLLSTSPAGTFFLFALMCVPYMLIVWKLVPETTGKSLEEIERYWTRSE